MSRAGISTKDLLRALLAAGWRVEQTKNSHWKCYSPNGKSIVMLAESDDWNAQRRNLTHLRRAGFEIPHGAKP